MEICTSFGDLFRPRHKHLTRPLEPTSAEKVSKSGGRKLRSRPAHGSEQPQNGEPLVYANVARFSAVARVPTKGGETMDRWNVNVVKGYDAETDEETYEGVWLGLIGHAPAEEGEVGIVLTDHEARIVQRELKEAALLVEEHNQPKRKRDYPLTADPQ